jgi:hypothetical protein
MDAIRLYAEFTDDVGTDWRLNIHDGSFGGVATEFKLAPAGFVLSYSGSNEDRFQAIVPSQVEFTLVEQNTTDAQILDLIPSAPEGRFTISIRKDPDGADTFWWGGVILAEQLTRPDEPYPTFNRLTATDDLGALSEIEYNDDGTEYTAAATLRETILNCLNKTRATHLWDATDTFLESVNDFVADNYSGADQLDGARVHPGTWLNKDGDGVAQYFTAFEVLESIATSFNARVFFSEGRYWFVPIGAHQNLVSMTVEHHRKDGTQPTTASEVLQAWVAIDDDFRKLSGYEHSYLAPAETVTRTQRYFGNLPEVFDSVLIEGDFGSTLTDDGRTYPSHAQFYISGLFQYTYPGDSSTGDDRAGRVEIQIKLKVGTKYLSRAATYAGTYTDFLIWSPEELTYTPHTYATTAWSTDAASRYDIVSAIFDRSEAVQGPGTIEIQIAILTPTLPTEQDSIELEVVLVGIDDGGGVDTGALISSGDYHINTLRVDFAQSGAANGDEIDFVATNPTAGARAELTQGPVLIGDSVSNNSHGDLKVYNAPNWEPSDGWTSLNHASPSMGLHRLGVQEILGGQMSATRIQRGTFYGATALAMWQVFVDGASYFLPFELVYIASRCETTVESWRVHRDVTGITSEESGVRNLSDPVIVAPGDPGGVIADTVAAVGAKVGNAIDDLSDVDTTTSAPTDGDHLEWATDKWQPAAPSGGGGGVTSVTGTTPIASTGGTTPAISIAAATTGAAGSMSAADKTKIDGVAAGAVSFPSDHCLWKGAATSGTAGSNTLSLSVTGNYISWSTLKAYYTVDVDTGSNTDADKVFTIPETGLWEFNTLAVFINTAGTDGTICKIILAINRDGSPADLCTRATLEIPAGQYTGASGALVFEATAGEEITPAIYFRRNGTGGSFKLTYFHTYLHAALRRIA